MRKLFFATFLLISFLSPIVVPSGSYVDLNSDIIGPYQKYQDDTEIQFNYTFHGPWSETLVETISFINPKTNFAMYKKSYESHTMRNGQFYSFSFPMRLKANFGNDGVKLNIIIKTTTEVLLNEEILLKPFDQSGTEQTVTSTNYKFKTEGLSFYIKDSEIIYVDDDITFDFNNLNLNHAYYYKLDFEKIAFSYNANSIAYNEAYLSFNDYRNVFPFLSHDKNNDIKIPLKLSGSSKKISANLTGNFYVNPVSLDMSDHKMEGFQVTSRFFFPRNMKQYIDSSNFTLYLIGLGHAGFNLKCPLTYYCDASLLGPCLSSDYCIVGDYF